MDAASSRSTTILSLNNDILFQLCRTLQLAQRHEYHQDRRRESLHTDTHTPLKNFSASCWRLRLLAAPLLFRKIRMESWEHVSHALASVETVKPHTRNFWLDAQCLEKQKFSLDDQTWPCVTIGQLLRGLSKLRHLTLILAASQIRSEQDDVLAQAFRDMDLTLPTIESLHTNPEMLFLLQHCPKTATLRMQPSVGSSLILPPSLSPTSLRTHLAGTSILHLELYSRSQHKLMESITTLMPNLESLSLPTRSQQDYYCIKMHELAWYLSQLKYLKHLALDDATKMDMGNQRPICDRPYRDPNGSELRQRLEAEKNQVQQDVSRMFFEACPRLERLSIGMNYRATADRGADHGAEGFRAEMLLTAIPGFWEAVKGYWD